MPIPFRPVARVASRDSSKWFMKVGQYPAWDISGDIVASSTPVWYLTLQSEEPPIGALSGSWQPNCAADPRRAACPSLTNRK